VYLMSVGHIELHSIAVDGGSPPVHLESPLVTLGDVSDFLTSPSGSTVVYRADQDIDSWFELYSVPADGSAAAVQISAAATQNVLTGWTIDPSGTRVVYRVAGSSQNLFSAPIDGSAPPVQLSSPLGSDRNVDSFVVSADGAVVAYLADEVVNNEYELFLVPTDGSAAPDRLTPVLANGRVLGGYQFAPDGSHVVYETIPGGGATAEQLFSVRTSDETVTALYPGGVTSFRISPDCARVVFLREPAPASWRNELFSVPISGGSAALRINPDFVSGGEVEEYALTPDSLQVLYRGDAETLSSHELYRVPIVPSGAPVATKLHPSLAAGRSVASGFRITADSAHVVFRADAKLEDVTELFRSALTGTPDATALSDPLPIGEVGDVSSFALQNGRCAYTADQDTNGQTELYGVPSDGSAPPVKLSGTLVPGGDVRVEPTAYALTTDGSRVVYVADADMDELDELYSAPTNGSAPPVKLNRVLAVDDEITPGEFRVSPDGTRVAYLADRQTFPGLRLFSVSIQGGSSALMGDVSSTDFEITADSARVLFVDTRLYSAPLDESAAPVDLSGAIDSLGEFAGSADGSRVLFQASAGGANHLFANSSAGGALVDLSGPLVSGGDVEEFAFGPGGQRVVYRADALVDDRFVLLSVPIDGSAPPIALNGPLVSGGDVLEFQVAPGGERAVYLADQEQNNRPLLYSVPIDGSAPSTRLSIFEPAGYALAPDGGRVLAILDSGLRSLPITGGSFVVLVPSVVDFRITANSRSVIHGGSSGWYSVPVTGGNPLRLTPEGLGSIEDVQLDGRRLVYEATVGTTRKLYSSLPSRLGEARAPTELVSRQLP